MIWPDEDIESLKALHAKGYTFSAIAEAFGGIYSRNAVIGKAQRLGLPRRKQSTSHKSGRAAARIKQPLAGRAISGLASSLATARLTKERAEAAREKARSISLANIAKREADDRLVSGASAVSLLDAQWHKGEPSQCRWPLTEIIPISEFRFCGAPVVQGCSWCAGHLRRAQGRGYSEAAE
jgi:GcrA cell cycle regulator